MAAEKEIRTSEERLLQARLRADVAEASRLLAEELAYGHSGGSVDTKASYLAALESGAMRYRSLDLDDLTVRVYGDAATVTARLRMHTILDGHEIRGTMRIANVWVRRDGRWQMVLLQSTRLPD